MRRGATSACDDEGSGARLREFLARHPRVAVLTGAGLSTGSGIPDYRDDDGNWKHRKPVQYAEFMAGPDVRRRYWARSAVGWPRFSVIAGRLCVRHTNSALASRSFRKSPLGLRELAVAVMVEVERSRTTSPR